ncbi:MAG: 50S ribosomal protein L3 [Phycisphaerales bacterium]|nr:50S ribosomal protein L3 [Phycisphaerales bacterium]MCI0630976.1 50S ribosomal protein L3 [Phycisphaerales bacterium]MCI0676780.1 50S ribosomal protein L3 [Phycisphaerales bacterium]
MPAGIIGRKIGMTRFFTEDGRNVPVTVIEAGPCAVTQVKTNETDGYAAVQLAFSDVKPRRSTMQVIGHDAKAGIGPRRVHRELRLDDDKAAGEYQLGQTIDVKTLENVKYVDVVGISKGKGTQGVMVRHHFKGMFASHGTERMHRHGGSIASHATNRGWGPKPKKNKRMPGRMGNERVSIRNLDVISIDPERNLLLVKGPVPGANKGWLFIRESKRLNKSKARKLAEAGKK